MFLVYGNQSGLFFRSSGGIYLCRDDVVARSSSLSFSAESAAAFFDSRTNSLCSAQPRFQEFIGWPCMKDAAHFRALTKRIAITLDTALHTRERID
jgi:hypothetical protein